MEVSRILDVTMDEMDAFVSQMVMQDIQEATNKTVSAKDVKPGYSYTKKLKGRNGREGRVKTTIRALESGKYHVTFKSAQGVNHLEYTYEPTEDGRVGITYSEEYEGSSNSKNLNFKLMSFLYKRSNQKRAKQVLANIEALIQENREKE